jgi:5-methylcytosine-specific restriction endonuclease McrA
MAAKNQGRSGRPWSRVKKYFKATNRVCWICGHWIPVDLPRNHPLEYTVDHVVPRSKGGPPTIANGRPAHRRCNSRRGVGDNPTPPVPTSRAW